MMQGRGGIQMLSFVNRGWDTFQRVTFFAGNRGKTWVLNCIRAAIRAYTASGYAFSGRYQTLWGGNKTGALQRYGQERSARSLIRKVRILHPVSRTVFRPPSFAIVPDYCFPALSPGDRGRSHSVHGSKPHKFDSCTSACRPADLHVPQ